MNGGERFWNTFGCQLLFTRCWYLSSSTHTSLSHSLGCGKIWQAWMKTSKCFHFIFFPLDFWFWCVLEALFLLVVKKHHETILRHTWLSTQLWSHSFIGVAKEEKKGTRKALRVIFSPVCCQGFPSVPAAAPILLTTSLTIGARSRERQGRFAGCLKMTKMDQYSCQWGGLGFFLLMMYWEFLNRSLCQKLYTIWVDFWCRTFSQRQSTLFL